MSLVTQFGFPDEWQAFGRRHPLFFETFANLKHGIDKGLNRTIPKTDLADKMILFLGNHCFEDFMEILLLAGNGYGIGAQKMIRGMYERAVIASYLAVNPEKAEDFLTYALKEKYTGIKAWVEAWPDDKRAAKYLADAQQRYDEVKDRFKGKIGWSGLDFVSMARSTGLLGKMLSEAYYGPLGYAHGTSSALVARLEWSEAGGYKFDGGPQREEADRALMIAHKIMIYVLGVQQDRFQPEGLDEAIGICLKDFVAIWKRDVSDDADGNQVEQSSQPGLN